MNIRIHTEYTDEYTEYHENVLQSYIHKQLNTQLQEYTEVPERQSGGTKCKKNFQHQLCHVDGTRLGT